MKHPVKAAASLISIGLLLSSSSVFAENIKPEIMIGTYWTENNMTYPLIAFSNDKGLSWRYSKKLMYSCSEHYAYPMVSCDNGFCLMTKSCKDKLFIATSNDQGVTWADQEITLPSETVYPSAIPMCHNQFCIYVGTYGSLHEEKRTLIFGISKDKGITWNYPAIKNFPDAKIISINDITCSDDSCIMVGQYNYESPLVITSNDQGETWSAVKVPNSGKGAKLIYVSCEGKSCVALGNDSGNLGAYILKSSNAGASWTRSFAGYIPPYRLNSLFCHGKVCAVAGYNNIWDPGRFTKEIPFAAVSQDQGLTWITPVLPWLKSSAYFNDISCSGKNCIAVGGVDDKALLAISRNGGLTWSYQKDLPAPVKQFSLEERGELSSIHCEENNCIIGGYFSDGKIALPWMLLSQDGGETWISPSTAISELPTDLSGGTFLSNAYVGRHIAELKKSLFKSIS